MTEFSQCSVPFKYLHELLDLDNKFLCIVVEVAIHTILYVRQVYPPDAFVRRKKYDTPVFQSRHPGLNQYISGAVKAIANEMRAASVYTFWTHCFEAYHKMSRESWKR